MKKTNKFVDNKITERIRLIVGEDIKAFALKANINYESVRLWCKGDYLPQVEHLIKIKKNIGINIDWLLFGTYDVEQTPFMSGWHEDAVNACKELKEVLDYGDKEDKEAVLLTIKQAKKIRELKKPVAGTSLTRQRKQSIK
jgi:hypothetical protein